MAAADATIAVSRAELKRLEDAAADVRRMLERVKIPAAAAAETVAAVEVEKLAIRSLAEEARKASSVMNDLGYRGGGLAARGYVAPLGYDPMTAADQVRRSQGLIGYPGRTTIPIGGGGSDHLFGQGFIGGAGGILSQTSSDRARGGIFGRLFGAREESNAAARVGSALERETARLFGGAGRSTGGSAASGLFGGILPGGARAGAGPTTAALGLLLAAGPSIGPAAAGLGLGATAGLGALVGGAGVLGLAFADLSKAAFTTQKAFDKLTPAQQAFVQTLRSFDAGFVKNLEATAQRIIIPSLTSALRSAITPASAGAISGGVRAFSGAVAGGAQQFGQMFGSSQFAQAFGAVLQADARYLREMVDEATHLISAFFHLQQAAIPLTDWMFRGADALAQWADRAVQASQASGGLASFFEKSKLALQGWGALLGSIGSLFGAVFGAIGFKNSLSTLDLISQVFRDLTQFVNANKNTLRDFFTGALAAAHGMLAVVNSILQSLTPLLSLIDRLVGGTKGWQRVIESLSAIWITRFALMRLSTLGLAAGTEIATARLAGLRLGLAGLAGGIVPIAIALSFIPPSGVGQQELDRLHLGFLGHLSVLGGAAQQTARFGNYLNQNVFYPDPDAGFKAQQAAAGNYTTLAESARLRAQMLARISDRAAKTKAGLHALPGALSNLVDFAAGIKSYASAYADPGALDQTGMPSTAVPFSGIGVLPGAMRQRLTDAQTRSAMAGGGSGFDSGHLRAAIGLSTQLGSAYAYLSRELHNQSLTAKQLYAVEKERVSIAKELARAQKDVATQLMAQHAEGVQDRMARMLGVGGGVAGLASLRTRTRHVEELIASMRGHGESIPKSTLESLHKIQAVLALALKEHVKLTDVVSQNVTARLAQINDTLKADKMAHPSSYHLPSVAELMKGLKGSPAVRRALAERLTEVEALGGKIPSGPTAFGYPTSGHGVTVNHFHGDIPIHVSGSFKDPALVAAVIHSELSKSARRNPTQTRGPNAGRNRNLN